ncbi:hypothetical protein [Parendozoicomonas sp. Alg238-R29]|uniref:hypothetical protein n=1 Tax=Parendozoicomonas sp. Alg238-R29 TaxID=2993446 RepID=UPI00248D64CC|nr:hypothetical protein [Parendozoicomonas sp. Alg238-R29]
MVRPIPQATKARRSPIRVDYHDPEDTRFRWAASLRPKTCGKKPGDRKLDQWLIGVIADYSPPKTSPKNFCIIGSRILQRILGTRYCDDIEDGQSIYQTNDIDLWARSISDQTSLIDSLVKHIEQNPGLRTKVTYLDNFQHGIKQRSIKICRVEANGRVTPLSSIDISAPLHSDKPNPRIEAADSLISRYIDKADHQPMISRNTPDGPTTLSHPTTLNDTVYLAALNEALSDPSCDPVIYEKLQDTVRLLIYMEVTRRLTSENVDDFCYQLIELVCEHLPEQHASLKKLLPYILGNNVNHLSPRFFEPVKQPKAKETAPVAKTYVRRARSHAIAIVTPEQAQKKSKESEKPEDLQKAVVVPVKPEPVNISETVESTKAWITPNLQMPDIQDGAETLQKESTPTQSTDDTVTPQSPEDPVEDEPKHTEPSPAQTYASSLIAGTSPLQPDPQVKEKPTCMHDQPRTLPVRNKGKWEKKRNSTAISRNSRREKSYRDTKPRHAPPPQSYISVEQLSRDDITRIHSRLEEENNYEKRIQIMFSEGVNPDEILRKSQTNPSLEVLAALLIKPQLEPPSPKPQPLPEMKLPEMKAAPKTTSPEISVAEAIIDSDAMPITSESTLSCYELPEDEPPLTEETKFEKAYRCVKEGLPGATSTPIGNWVPGEEAITEYLVTGKLPDISANPSPCLTEAVRLKGLLPVLITHTHAGSFAWNGTPVLELREGSTQKQQVLEQLDEVGMAACPYTDYLKGVMLTQTSGICDNGIQALLNAASAGVTGAAIELLRLSFQKHCPLPASVALRLLKNCVERPSNRQYKLRFQSSSYRPPFSGADRIIATIEQQLGGEEITNEHWRELGEKLNALSHFLPDERERCMLVAACAMNFSGDFAEAMEYKKNIGKKVLASLHRAHALDWFIQSLPMTLSHAQDKQPKTSSGIILSPEDITLPDTLKTCPAAEALYQILLRNSEGLDTSIVRMCDPAQSYGSWPTWLPLCLPGHTGLGWMKNKDALKNYWKHLLKLQRVRRTPKPAASTELSKPEAAKPKITGAADIASQTASHTAGFLSSPAPSPLNAKRLREEIDRDDPSSAAGVPRDYDNLDRLLLDSLAVKVCPPDGLPQSPLVNQSPANAVTQGCELTAEALTLIGAQLSDRSPDTSDFHNIPPEKCAQAITLLKQAIDQFGNPYACWAYSRLIRPNLIARLATEQGEKDWYEYYLAPMMFAATMGVNGAAEDLMAELLAGRADALMIAIVSMITCRQLKAKQFSLKLNFPAICKSEFLDHITNYDGNGTNNDWCAYLLKGLTSIYEDATASPDTCHMLRDIWIYALLHKTCPTADKSIQKLGIPRALDDLKIPDGLQICIATSLNYFGPATKSYYERILVSFLSPPARALADLWVTPESKRTTNIASLTSDDSVKLLTYLQWQPGIDNAVNASQQLKANISRKNTYVRDNIIPNERLMRLVQCTLASDLRQSLPECRDPFIRDIQPWPAIYQFLKPDAEITLLTPSSDLESQFHELERVDDELLKGLTGEKPDPFNVSSLKDALYHYCDSICDDTIILEEINPQLASKLLVRLTKLQKHKPQNPYLPLNPYQPLNPYLPLIKGLCIEIKHKEDAGSHGIAYAGAELVNAAMHGCDDAARHLARLALRFDSPISMERVLDVFLIQYQRARRHKLRFLFPPWNLYTHEINNIINTLDRTCLGAKSPKKPLRVMIKSELIPKLMSLVESTSGSEASSKLSLLISTCHQIIGENQVHRLYSSRKLSGVSASTMHQWVHHLKLTYKDTDEDYKRALAQIVQLDEKLSQLKIPYRTVPYFVDNPAPDEKQWQRFIDWYGQIDNWYQLPAMMGQMELKEWQEGDCAQQFQCLLPKEGDAVCHGPGPERTSAHYRNSLYLLITNCLLEGNFLRLPYPADDAQLAMAKYWYDQLRIDLGDFGCSKEATSQPPKEPGSASSGKTKKKSKKKTHSVGDSSSGRSTLPEKPEDSPAEETAL